jgi:hypothetical protein
MERFRSSLADAVRQRAFVRVTLVAALVLGSHAMYDTFAVIRRTQAGISPATVGVLGAESVAAEVLVFLSWVQDCCEWLHLLPHWRWRHLPG